MVGPPHDWTACATTTPVQTKARKACIAATPFFCRLGSTKDWGAFLKAGGRDDEGSPIVGPMSFMRPTASLAALVAGLRAASNAERRSLAVDRQQTFHCGK